MRSRYICAALTLIILILVMICAGTLAHGQPEKGRAEDDHYLVAPYLDLDAPGERGSYYAMADSPCALV